ncbi:transglutaminase domain-containing protein [Cohnella nanjingensis]|uniref:Transglutaminase domain-containing protein n=1 Tax=Cohnella nanjingensis TaxID=1387779 RepID=A0A7X0RUG5_9BACL|nr:transglutaminase domain-containing protein [Cohnella nanjingensis]MBB6673932.1 transglutaminase domain-containing protein [Cohnella nanjingensis]
MNTMMMKQSRPLETRFWRRLVLERLHRLFAIVIVLQLIQCFQSYWWEETYAVIYATLGVVVVSELLISRAYFARLGMQMLTVLLATVAFAPFKWYGWPENWRAWDEVRRFLTYHVDQFHPYVELAAGVVLAVHYLSVWGTTRARAILLILTAIFVLAGVDSFLPFELWKNIAWTVLAGLGWLVVLHLRQLRERHYDSWDALAERPFELAVPAVLVIGLLMLAGIAVPRAPVLLEDPYTIWMESQNKEVPSFAGEGGYLSNGSSVSGGSSGSSKSGYGRNDSKIGGGFQFDYSPIMQVTTDQKAYWRGETKAIYTGKGWSDRKGLPTVPVTPGEETLPLDPARPEGAETKKVSQTFTMLRKDRIPVLFAAGPARTVNELQGVGGSAKLSWSPEEWELKFQRPVQPESYAVTSEVLVLDAKKLRETKAGADDGSVDLTPYLQLPDALPKRIADLAKEATGDAANDYDRAKRLERYLQLTYPYTNTPDVSRQKSEDVVDAFLFEIKEGYCDYYSTAFVVMARTLGFPARWVKGYTSGSNPQESENLRMGGGYIPDPSGAGTYTVRNSDAHSWAEIYFEGIGWVPFEPTAGFSVPQPIHEDELPTYDPVVPSADDGTDAASASSGGGSRWIWIASSVVGALLALSVAAWTLLRRKSWNAVWQQVRYRGSTPNQRIVREMERLLSFLNRRGLKRQAHDTLRESFSRWGAKFASLRPDLEGVLQQFEAARYGGGSGRESDFQHFSQLAAKIRKSL